MATSTRWIEESAVNALKTVLLRCPLLESYIDYNDRTPSWDGAIFVYNHQDKKKEHLVGRVPVQVKGTKTQIVSDIATYSCDIKDLKNYYNDGGCLYFRISVIPETGENTIFYSVLQVYDLKKMLDDAGNQKSYTIKMQKLPVLNSEEITAICLDFIENARKQKSFIGKELKSLEELEQNGVEIESLLFSTSGVDYDPVKIGNYLSTHDFYLYAKPQGLDIEIPVDKVSNATLIRKVQGKIQVEDRTYYLSYAVVHENGEPRLNFGKGLSMKLDFDHNSASYSYRPSGTLDDIILDTECLVDMMEKHEITINGRKLHFNLSDPFDSEKYRTALRYYKDIKAMLDCLGVVDPLKYDDLSEQDGINIKNFVNAVLYNRRIGFPGVDAESTIYGAFVISNLTIWLWATKQDDGYYQIENFFIPHRIVFFTYDDVEQNNPIPVSHYLLLNKDSFIRASNMDIEAVKNDIALMNPHPALVDKVTFMLLDVLSGYDEQEKKDARLLDLADTINAWLSNDANCADPHVLKLNQLQIVKRRRQFVFSERADLIDLTRAQDPYTRCGAFLLLDENEEAQKCFEELTPENQEQFLLYPISHFGNLSKK